MNRPNERSTLTAAGTSQQPATKQQTGEQSASSRSEGLSIQTLLIAALASGTAAIVTSIIWPGGTVLSAAMTPVIVSLVREALQRPAQRIASVRTGRLGEALPVSLRDQLDSARQGEVKGRLPLPSLPSLKRGHLFEDAPYGRVYGRRRVRMKAALVTGGLAFLIAAVCLTLPELVFGGAVTGQRSTTFFGGGGSQPTQRAPQGQGAPSGTSPTSTTPNGGFGQSEGQGGSGSPSAPSGGGGSSAGPSGQSPGGSASPNQSSPQQPPSSRSSPPTETAPGGSLSP